jgi:hypothetical protein
MEGKENAQHTWGTPKSEWAMQLEALQQTTKFGRTKHGKHCQHAPCCCKLSFNFLESFAFVNLM